MECAELFVTPYSGGRYPSVPGSPSMAMINVFLDFFSESCTENPKSQIFGTTNSSRRTL